MNKVLPFVEARRVVEAKARAIRPHATEELALADTMGRVLAEPIVADRDFPPFPRSTRDGFAVRAADVATVPARMRRIGEIRQIRTSGNQLTLSVLTESGPATLRLEKPGEGSQRFGRSGMLLADAVGSYYIIADRGALPKWQQRLLTLYFGD